MIEQSLARVPLFASLPAGEIEYLAGTLKTRVFSPNELLFKEGDSQGLFYILLDGEVEVIKSLGTEDERRLAVRPAGSMLGEMSVFSADGRHTASVRARTPLRLLEMSNADFEALIRREPAFAYEMMRTLSGRLAESENLTIKDLREKNRQLTQAYEELKAAQAQIIEKEKLERELEVARQIQRTLLPRAVPQRAGYEFGARMVPMSAVGGDFYDFIPLGDDTLGIAVGDVSDHGVPSALLMALTVTLLRAEARRASSPREAFDRINQQLIEGNDLGMFVTLLFGTLKLTTQRFDYIRAGHELPLVVGPDGDLIHLDRKPGQPLGLLPEPIFDEGSLAVPKGGLMLVFTDGVTETASPDGVMFGLSGIESSVRRSTRLAADQTCDDLMAALSDFRGGQPQSDDITLVAVRAG
jgi:sigma-B regulation protein RsbU (phosphoserine phosphatase)